MIMDYDTYMFKTNPITIKKRGDFWVISGKHLALLAHGVHDNAESLLRVSYKDMRKVGWLKTDFVRRNGEGFIKDLPIESAMAIVANQCGPMAQTAFDFLKAIWQEKVAGRIDQPHKPA